MLSLLRFKQLQQRNIVKNRPQLKRLQEKHGFPKGKLVSPNIRAWTEDEVYEWYQSRPAENAEPKGIAKSRRGRPRKPKANTTEAATTT